MATFKPEPQKDGRYWTSVAGRCRVWTSMEDHVLRAVMLSSYSVAAFAHGCEFLCRVLDRQPAKASHWKPSERWWKERRVALISNRLGDLVLKYREHTIDPLYRTRARTGAAWTIVEVEEVLERFRKSKHPEKPRTTDHLARLLARDPDEVTQALAFIEDHGTQDFERRYLTTRSQSRNFDEPEVERLVREFLRFEGAADSTYDDALKAWKMLTSLLEIPY